MSKTRLSLIWMWTVWAVIVCLLVTSDVYAQSATSTDGGFQRMMNNIVRNTSGVTNVSVGGGVSTTANGVVNVNAGVGRIPINTSATASVSRAAIAKGAARVAMRALPWVATAVVINDIADAVKDSGIVTCPPPDFFCNTKQEEQPPQEGIYLYRYTCSSSFCQGWNSTPIAACEQRLASANAAIQADGMTMKWTITQWPKTTYPQDYTCAGKSDGRPPTIAAGSFSTNQLAVMPITKAEDCKGLTFAAGSSCPFVQPIGNPGASTEQDLQTAIDRKIASDNQKMLDMFNKLQLISQQNPGLDTPIDIKAAPLAVTAPPVTGPSTVVSTETLPNPDGTTSTKQVTEQVKVTPQIAQPSTVANPNTTFPSTTTQTTKVTNNTTNTSTTTTTIINNPAPAPEALELELPTDYNREVTQKSILDILKSWSEPIKETLPDGNAEEQAIKAENDKGSTAINDITAAGVGIASWFPSVPTAPCVNPQVPMPLTGGAIAFPICNYVDTFRLFITAVICFFCILGCKNQVQSALRV